MSNQLSELEAVLDEVTPMDEGLPPVISLETMDNIDWDALAEMAGTSPAMTDMIAKYKAERAKSNEKLAKEAMVWITGEIERLEIDPKTIGLGVPLSPAQK
jgi:hypothetical protein